MVPSRTYKDRNAASFIQIKKTKVRYARAKRGEMRRGCISPGGEVTQEVTSERVEQVGKRNNARQGSKRSGRKAKPIRECDIEGSRGHGL